MSDNQLLYTASIVCFLLIMVSFRHSRKFGVINMILFCLYNSILYYHLIFDSSGGAGLVWWFFLLVLSGFQMLIVRIYLWKGFRAIVYVFCRYEEKYSKSVHHKHHDIVFDSLYSWAYRLCLQTGLSIRKWDFLSDEFH